MGFDSAVRRADDDARQDYGRNASVLAHRAGNRPKFNGNRRFDLACVARLSRRNVDVWQKGDDSRSLEMDLAELNNI